MTLFILLFRQNSSRLRTFLILYFSNYTYITSFTTLSTYVSLTILVSSLVDRVFPLTESVSSFYTVRRFCPCSCLFQCHCVCCPYHPLRRKRRVVPLSTLVTPFLCKLWYVVPSFIGVTRLHNSVPNLIYPKDNWVLETHINKTNVSISYWSITFTCIYPSYLWISVSTILVIPSNSLHVRSYHLDDWKVRLLVNSTCLNFGQ